MNAVEHELLEALVRLERVVGTGAPGPKPGLAEALQGIQDTARRLPPGTSGELLHYLGKRSYEKARLWLEGKDPEQGVCPR
jgi:hypothetical protein